MTIPLSVLRPFDFHFPTPYFFQPIAVYDYSSASFLWPLMGSDFDCSFAASLVMANLYFVQPTVVHFRFGSAIRNPLIYIGGNNAKQELVEIALFWSDLRSPRWSSFTCLFEIDFFSVSQTVMKSMRSPLEQFHLVWFLWINLRNETGINGLSIGGFSFFNSSHDILFDHYLAIFSYRFGLREIYRLYFSLFPSPSGHRRVWKWARKMCAKFIPCLWTRPVPHYFWKNINKNSCSTKSPMITELLFPVCLSCVLVTSFATIALATCAAVHSIRCADYYSISELSAHSLIVLIFTCVFCLCLSTASLSVPFYTCWGCHF